MDRREAIIRGIKWGILPGFIVGGLIGLSYAMVFHGQLIGNDILGRVLLLFPMGGFFGALIGAIIGALIADLKNPP